MQGTTENVREETLRLVGSGDADEQREGIEKGLELLDRDTGYEQPAGIVTGEITTGRRGRTTVSASLEWKTTGGARRPQVVTLLALDDAAPLLSPREVHKQLRRAANAASNAGDANALDQLLRSAGDWIPVPAEEDDEALWRPTPAMWKQAEQGAGTYHQRRATALNAAHADARGLYLERHDPAAQAAACSTDATVALGREAVENLCRNCPPGETGSGILETTLRASETTAWPAFEAFRLDPPHRRHGLTLAAVDDTDAKPNAAKRIVVHMNGGHEGHAHALDTIAGLLDPQSVRAALTSLAIMSLDEQQDDVAGAAIAAAARWTAVPKPGAPVTLADYEMPAGLAPGVEIDGWQRRVDRALHVARRIHRHGRYLRQRRSNTELAALRAGSDD